MFPYSLTLFAGGLVTVVATALGAVLIVPEASVSVIAGTAIGAGGVWVLGFFTKPLADWMMTKWPQV
jgi:hypothetical protein